MTQERLAQAAGLSRAAVADVELGRYKSTDGSTVERLAQALEVSVAELQTPHLESRSMDQIIDQFVQSDWYRAVKPDPSEMKWLHSLPRAFWTGIDPQPEAIATAIKLRRDFGGGRRGAKNDDEP
jgi:transcriptional regulator with XRE-family HTH domain